MTFEQWYRQEHPMCDDTFNLVVKESTVYLAMKKAWDAGKEEGKKLGRDKSYEFSAFD